ncbi:lasso RiPP family leader peptide-containing protein [Streptomyces coeruleorubidus]|uniref:Lasso RiPP family leader peptide-containing protein n=1 Tax=Streptomyces coeruleorubidus TaxID=116188 RepID=A0A5J6IPD9_STRC4|nr:lasso RiPP family leader peptide-containing protein [Streptomyces coeruleorubidus]QEV30605.1 lasso RiPP family leader peptide-containing protein [Streptomyces coeruleorubidus]
MYVPPMLVEVGEFSEDTLGFGGWRLDSIFGIYT